MPVEHFQSSDKQKKELAASQGITLIVVPCWWDGKQERLATLTTTRPDCIYSLLATIRRSRPDLLQHLQDTAEPIPENPPADYFAPNIPHVEDVGQPTTAGFLTLSAIDPAKWYARPGTYCAPV